jgi:D-galactose 1-dehydrogenase
VRKIPIAIVGFGKIARDQHVPTICGSDAFELVAIASPHSRLEGVPAYPSIERLLAARPGVAAVALCTPPQVRYQAACHALGHRKHVLLEKPPGVTVSEAHALARLAEQRGVSLLASWHSRHAAAVQAARAWLRDRRVLRATVTWKEDVRVWHPGQAWIWQAGGLGVFDPGINALSILTHIVPGALALREAELSFPANAATPIAARLSLVDPAGAPIEAVFDFRQTGPQTWDIDVETDGSRLTLTMGGSVLRLDGKPVEVPKLSEYASVYQHFAALVRGRKSDVDLAAFQLVADAFLCGRRVVVEPFIE